MQPTEIVYDINGFKYKFVNIRNNGGVKYGYSPRKKRWAFLFPTYIQFEGESIVMAKKVSEQA